MEYKKDPAEVFFREYYGNTTLHPLGLTMVLVLGLAMLLVPRRWALLPMIILACFVSPAQRVAPFGLDFDLLRLMILFAWARIAMRGEFRGLSWQWLDTAFVAWLASGTLCNTMLWGSMNALINRLGWSYDAIGMYFAFRFLVRDWEDVDRIVTMFIGVSLPVAAVFLIEHFTAHNMFAIFGGVPEVTAVRRGRLRCQGAFAHPILAGCFWASLMPLFAARWWRGGAAARLSVPVGLGTSSVIVLMCSSATPVTAVLAAMLGGAMFPARRYMRWVRWGVFLTLLALHMVMKKPVWHLVSRIDIVSGSTGYHRYLLVNAAVTHFSEWWKFGAQTTEHWGVIDITNAYILEGIRGGLLTLALYILIIVLAFRAVGQIVRGAGGDTRRLATGWALGVSLFVHMISYLAISYFGQITMVWYLLLAMIASLSALGVKRGALSPAAARAATQRGPPRGRSPVNGPFGAGVRA